MYQLYHTPRILDHFQQIHYQYKIDDQLWQDIGNARFVTLTGMNAGKHIVYARSNIGEGLWIEAKPREIFIEKPYYLKTHFLLTGLIFLLFIFFGIYRLLRFIANKEAKIKLSYSRELAQIEMKALRSQMNPHFIFNSLNSIYNFILTNNTNQAADYLSKFSKLIRKVLENSKHTRVHIDDELQVISLYMELEKLRFNDKFDYELDIDSQIDQSNIQIPPMIIQPFLENAVWHGIMHKNQGGLIRLSMRMHQKNLIV